MYIVNKAYDDKSADILDITNGNSMHLDESGLVGLDKNHSVYGLACYKNKVSSLQAYDFMTFATEVEADEWIREAGLNNINKLAMSYGTIVLIKSNVKYHVPYYVGYYRGDPHMGDYETLVAEGRGYTNYREAAKEFTKTDAEKKAAIMRNRSKSDVPWKAIRGNVTEIRYNK